MVLLDELMPRCSYHVYQSKNRYVAQKRRMRLSGLSRTIYLFEGDLENYRKATTGADKTKTARTAEVATFAGVSFTNPAYAIYLARLFPWSRRFLSPSIGGVGGRGELRRLR